MPPRRASDVRATGRPLGRPRKDAHDVAIIACLIGSPLFREVIPALVTHLSTDEAAAQAYLRDFVGIRRDAVRIALARAAERDEIGHRPDLDLVYDTLTGSLFYRAVARRERISTAFADVLVDVALALIPGP